MRINSDGQPINQSFNASRNKEKAIYGLRGILAGVTADKKLNEQELLFLDAWLRSQSYLRDDGDVVDLVDLIGEILQDGVITTDELHELKSLINDVINYKEIDAAEEESQINELLGVISGIAADNLLNDSEINHLLQWLNNNSNIQDTWPASILISRINLILEDGIITQEEREQLLETINGITGDNFSETGLAYGMATDFLEDPIESLVYEGACFCFTGKFVFGSRGTVENSVIKKGSTTNRDVTKNVDFLVIGTLASRDWRFSSHGRKIEKALKLKEANSKIVILSERTWQSFG